ncbi:MAG: hypothetical protein LW704_04030 [Cryomorphaceae bacterium]|jgi:hypothetical protein|nr:hypothetical protein [Cryomorphaceae bacterium]
MNVHLLRSPELNVDTYRDVILMLRQFPGPIRYLESELGIMDAKPKEHFWENEKKFNTKEQVMQVSLNLNEKRPLEFPLTDHRLSWIDLFRQCYNYRSQRNIPTEDHVILLTDIGNDKNWFGAMDDSRKNYFVHTANWKHFFKNEVDVRFPIAYEVITWLLRSELFGEKSDMQQYLHQKSIGCFMDYCENKMEIILKMRTADICLDCLEHINQKDLQPNFVTQILETMDGIRSNLIFRERVRIMRKPSRIVVDGFMKQIHLVDFGNLCVRLNPKERALFLLYLNHPEGISIPELFEHGQEIFAIYRQISGRESEEEMRRTILNLLNPLEDDISINLSRIRRKFKDAVGEELLPFYDIRGEHGEKKYIKLDRELVTYKN